MKRKIDQGEELAPADKVLYDKWFAERLKKANGGGMLIIITYTNTIIYHYHY